MNNQNNSSQQLKGELATLLIKSHAHVSFDDAFKDIPFDDLGKKPNNVPYSIWQQVEHIRIAQKDILDFSLNKDYKELNWPDGYWVTASAPENEAAWNQSISNIQSDLKEFIEAYNMRMIFMNLSNMEAGKAGCVKPWYYLITTAIIWVK